VDGAGECAYSRGYEAELKEGVFRMAEDKLSRDQPQRYESVQKKLRTQV
jgi:hypothetical protein